MSNDQQAIGVVLSRPTPDKVQVMIPGNTVVMTKGGQKVNIAPNGDVHAMNLDGVTKLELTTHPSDKAVHEFRLRSRLQLMEDKEVAYILWIEHLLIRGRPGNPELLKDLKEAKETIDKQPLRPDTMYMRQEDFDDILAWKES